MPPDAGWNSALGASSWYWTPGAISYLTEALLASIILGYLGMRVVGDWRRSRLYAPTVLLTVLMSAIALAFLASMFRVLVAGGWVSYAMPWSPVDAWSTLAMPWARPFGGVICAALFLFAYRFPRPLPGARLESIVVAAILAMAVAVECAFAVYADIALLRGEPWWRPSWITLWMAIALIGSAVTFWRQFALAQRGGDVDIGASRHPWAATMAIWRLPTNREAKAARAFLLLALLPLVHIAALLVPEGRLGSIALDVFVCWSTLAMLLGLTLVYLSYLPERSSFLFKLTTIGIAVLLAGVNGVAWIIGPTHQSQFRPPDLIASGQALRFAPLGNGDYAAQRQVFLTEPVRGEEIGPNGARIELLFELDFYGRRYDRVFVDRLGTIGFDRVPTPTDAAFGRGVQPAIYPLLASTPRSGSRITAFADSERLVLTRLDRCRADQSDPCFRVQTIIFADGRIDINYLEMPPTPSFKLFDPLHAPWLIGITPGPAPAPGLPLLRDYYHSFLIYLDRLFKPLVGFTIATVLAALVGLPLLFRSFLIQPLNRLLRGIRRFRDGDLTTQVEISFNDEIGYLIESFNEMAHAQHAMTQGLENRVAARVAEIAHMTARNAQLEERTRLSADLHDAVAQTLASASLFAAALPERLRGGAAADVEAAEHIAKLNRHALIEMRGLLTELRGGSEGQWPLTHRLGELATEFSRLHGLTVTCDLADDAPLPPEVYAIFYRVAQECLNNVVKHSSASEAEMIFDALHDRAMLMVSDQGKGFDMRGADRRERLGLAIMEDRARLIGATLEIESSPGDGCRVTMIWTRSQ